MDDDGYGDDDIVQVPVKVLVREHDLYTILQAIKEGRLESWSTKI